MTDDFREAFRTLLLLDPARENESIEASQAALAGAGIESDDQPEFIRLELALDQIRSDGIHVALSAMMDAARERATPSGVLVWLPRTTNSTRRSFKRGT